MAVGIYARLSKNRDSKSESVSRQLSNGRAYAEGKFPGIPIKEYSDDGITAADDNVYRPDYERLKADIISGTVTHVVCRDQDRISRTEEWFKFQTLMTLADIEELHTYHEGIIPVDSDVADFKAVMARREARKNKKRTREALESLAQQRRPVGGRSFGYRHATNDQGQPTLCLIPGEAGIARDVVAKLIAGWSLTSACKYLNDEVAVPTVRGSKWTPTNLRRILTAPIVAGLRVHRGEIVGPINPDYLDEAVLDTITWQTLCAVLQQRGAHRATKAPKSRPGAQRYLLVGGILVCGRCTHPMRSHKRRNQRTGDMVARYMCDSQSGGCGRTAIKADALESYVVDRVLSRHWDQRRHTQDSHERDRASVLAAIDALGARRQSLVSMHVRGELSEAEWLEARGTADQELERLQADLSAIPAPVQDHGLWRADSSDEWWNGKPIEEQRQILASWVSSIVVGPGVPGARVITREALQARVSINHR